MENYEIYESEVFNNLTSMYPSYRYNTCYNTINLFSPIGKGQRCLVVAPPKAGKTTLIKNIAKSLQDDAQVNVLLVGERPEEVTDFIRSIDNCRIYSSTFKDSATSIIEISNKCLEDSIQMVLEGKDVIMIIDSLSRLVRACNLISNTGKVLSGGIDAGSFEFPKKLFGSAGSFEECGSLTIIATCLIETGSKMDEVIYEEFKGTGNSEIVLSREISESDVYPAIDIVKSGTRNDHLLLPNIEFKVKRKCIKHLSTCRDYSLNNEIINKLNNMSIAKFIDIVNL